MRRALAGVVAAAGFCGTSVLRAAQPEGTPATDVTPTQPTADVSPQQQPTDAEMEAAMQAVDDRIAKIEDLRADFKQHKSSAMLRKPMVSSGKVFASKDVAFWRTREPRESDMRVGGGEIRLFYPDDKLLEIYPIHNAKAMAGGPLPRLQDLREQFIFARESEQPPVGNTLHVLLTPRSEEMKNVITNIKVTIDTSVPCVTKIVMTDPDGEVTWVEFTQIRINTGMKESDLAIKVPEGTRESRPLEGSPGEQPPESPPQIPPKR